jgi:hypothetical protein
VADRHPLETFRADIRLDPDRRERITAQVAERVRRSAPDTNGRRPFVERPAQDLLPSSGPHKPPAAPPAQRGLPDRRALIAAATVLVAVLGLSITAGLRHSGTAVDALTVDDLAVAARQGGERELGEGEHVYHAEETGHATATGPELVEQWIASDGTGRSRRTTSSPLTLVADAPLPPTAPEAMDFAGLSYQELRTLPTDPSSLLDRLMELGVVEDRRSPDMVGVLAELLTFDVTPAEVRGTIVRSLALLGGEVRGVVADARGRRGVAVSGHSRDGTGWTVIIDPANGLALAANTAASIPGPRPPDRPSWRLWFPMAR